MTEQDRVEFELMKVEVKALHVKLDKLDTAVEALLDAWTTADGMVKMVKILSTIAVTCSVFWFLGKDLLEQIFFINPRNK